MACSRGQGTGKVQADRIITDIFKSILNKQAQARSN